MDGLQLSDLPDKPAFKTERFKGLLEDLNSLIDRIVTKDFRVLTEETLKVASFTFWTKHCSLKYHPVDERGLYGNLIHSIRVAKLCLIMVDSCAYRRWDIDRVLSGALVHDVCRYGLDGKSQWTHPDHPRLVRQLMDENDIGLSNPVRETLLLDIEKHMGRWDKASYAPRVVPSDLLHLADAIDAKLEDIGW